MRNDCLNKEEEKTAENNKLEIKPTETVENTKPAEKTNKKKKNKRKKKKEEKKEEKKEKDINLEERFQKRYDYLDELELPINAIPAHLLKTMSDDDFDKEVFKMRKNIKVEWK